MEMPLVRLEDRPMVPRAAHNGERRVEDRQPERENRHDEGDRRRTLDRTDDRDAREHEAEEHAARIAHKDTRGVEVVVEKADRRARERRCQHCNEGDALLHRHEKDRDCGNGGDPRSQAIQPVNQVDRIRQTHNPEDRRGNRKPFKIDEVAQRVSDKVDAHIKRNDEHSGRDDLPEQLHLRRQVAVVVNDTDGNDDCPADHEPDETHHVLRREVDKEELHEDRHHECGVDPDAADARNRARVHLACVGLVERPRAPRKGNDTGCDDERHAKRDHKC